MSSIVKFRIKRYSTIVNFTIEYVCNPPPRIVRGDPGKGYLPGRPYILASGRNNVGVTNDLAGVCRAGVRTALAARTYGVTRLVHGAV